MELLKKVQRVITRQFQNAKPELEVVPPGKVAGFVIWKGFRGMEQIVRQDKLWAVLESRLLPGELARVSAILTLTPEEASVED